MIDLNFSDPVDIVRANIGDPNGEFITDNSILSSLSLNNDDVVKSTIQVMEAMLSYFLTQAELERTAMVEYEYKKLYERYKSRLQEFQDKYASKYTSGIIIGGVSIKEVNEVNSNDDNFTVWLNDTYQDLMMSDRLVRQDDYLQD